MGSRLPASAGGGGRPVYAVDHPVASQALGADTLRPLLASGRALVGIHLPPWVSPPFAEDVDEFNSFPGSLPPSLERAKLAAQTGGNETSLGVRPLVYKAGCYGIGPNTVGILEALGHLVDLSPSPPFDYRSIYGPDFGRRGVKPAWYHSSTNIQLAYGVAERAGLTTWDLSGHRNDGTLSSAIMWTKTGRGYRSLSGASTNGARARVCIAGPESRAGSAAERTWECVSIFCQKIVVALIA